MLFIRPTLMLLRPGATFAPVTARVGLVSARSPDLCLRAPLWTSRAAWQQTKSKGLQRSSQSGQQGALQTSFAEKTKENAKTAWYGGVILLGVGVTAAMGYTILKELFAGDSPNALFQKASQVCMDNPKVQDLLGEPIKAFGEETRRGRRRHVSSMEYRDEEGRRGIRVKFYLQGLRRRGTALLDAREDSSGNMGTRFLIVTTDDLLGTSVVVEDNRQRLTPPQAPPSLTTH